ncbi:hypothetical protein D9M70_583150 [compost metagenome]
MASVSVISAGFWVASMVKIVGCDEKTESLTARRKPGLSETAARPESAPKPIGSPSFSAEWICG